ncbi:MAG: hypothetical protein K9N23_17445 [Akkermansiaceae bacterium]|nr:hypothetical protein [Akkermansiaceae bacterium]MCF7733479.1 hypothetical protein [Akkermansiaceae bacterium]
MTPDSFPNDPLPERDRSIQQWIKTLSDPAKSGSAPPQNSLNDWGVEN